MKKRKICVSRVLKMTSLFFLSCAMCAQAETVSSQSIRITLNKNNVRLENILNDIESQTNLLFIYNKNSKCPKYFFTGSIAEPVRQQCILQNRRFLHRSLTSRSNRQPTTSKTHSERCG